MVMKMKTTHTHFVVNNYWHTIIAIAATGIMGVDVADGGTLRITVSTDKRHCQRNNGEDEGEMHYL